jgi:competence protein ComEC
MYSFQKIPVLKLLIPFVFGILCYQKNTIIDPTVLGGLLIFVFTIYLYVSNLKTLTYIIISNLILFTIGYTLCFVHDEKKLNNFLGNRICEEKQDIIGEIIQIDIKKEYSKILVMVDHIGMNDTLYSTTGRLMCTIKSSAAVKNLDIGEKILFKTNIKNTSPSKNPYSFDYAKYLSRSNIYYQAFINDCKVIDKSKRNSIDYYATKARDYFVNIIHFRIADSKTAAVASALLLGYKNDLDNDTKKDYAETGSVHILAVSGMHVMIFYIGIEYLLSLIPFRSRRWDLFKILLTNLIIWFYVFITGLPGSVLRAGLMFSIASFGKLIHRKGNIYNSILASVLILLVYNPNLVYDVGFQLSYMAVVGIVYFSPKIEQLIQPTNKILSKVWTITALALAAQITTLPLVLFYFHQFPTYFLLAGMIAVPISEIAMFAGMGLFIFEKIPFLSKLNDLISPVLSFCINVMNKTLEIIAKFPLHTIEGFWINSWDILLIYLSIICILISLKLKKLYYLNLALILFLIVVVQNSLRIYDNSREKSITFYHCNKKNMLIDIFDNSNRTTLKNIDLEENQENMAALNFRYYKASGNENILLTDSITNNFKNNSEIIIDNKRLVIINNNNFGWTNCDWVFINSGKVDDMSKLNKLNAKCIIIGNSVPNYKAIKIKNNLENKEINCHILSIDGSKTIVI